MTSLATALAGYALVLAAGILVGAAIARIILHGVAPSLRRIAPGARARLLFTLMGLPGVIAAALALAFSAPLDYLGPDAAAHCARHAQAHATLCQWHAPQIALPAPLVLAGLALWGMIALAAIRGVVRIAGGWRHLRHLQQLARREPGGRYRRLDTPVPLAFVAGPLAGAIYISRGLEQRLDDRRLAIVIAHEQAHLSGRDLCAGLAVRVFSRLCGPATARRLRGEWQLAIEQRCDEVAARATGDRVDVAQCLVAVARLQQDATTTPAPARAACSLVGSDLDARVESLLASAHPASRAITAGVSALWLIAASGALVIGTQLHHWSEWLLPAVG